MESRSRACLLLIVTVAALSTVASLDITADWTDLTTGLNNQTLSIGLGTPDVLVLRGNAFPVIVSQDGAAAMMAAARVSDAGGKVVAFNKEAYMQSCGNEASPATALNCWLAVNSLRWAAGVPATAAGGTNGTNSFRLAISNNIVSSTTITNIKAAATALGFTINFPTGLTTNVINDVSVLTNANGVRIADVLLTDSYKSYTTAQRSAIVSFVQAGAGLVLGGQAWSTGGNITQYNGNLLLEPLNCIRWTADYGDARSIYVGVAPPDPMSFNADLSAAALLDHLKGTTLLAADVLAKVTTTVVSAIGQTSFTWATPQSSSSAALFLSFGSQLEQQLSSQIAGWTCGKVDSSVPANKVAAAYLAKRNTDLLPELVTPLPCSSNFPGAPGAGAATLTSTSITLNATYSGSYTGPMPPRGGTKWLSTGWWAPAGQIVTVSIPPAVAAALAAGSTSLGVQVGSHSDNIQGKSTWCRLPYNMLTRRWFSNAAGGETITIASGMGGLIYIMTRWGNTQGPIQVTVTGAMQAPFYFRGVTTEEQWRTSLRNSPVPWAELGSDKFVFTVPSASIANLDNPEEVVAMWDKVLDAYSDLTVFTRDRPRAERVVLDCDISAGWMHSGYPIMAYQSEADKLQLPKWIGRDNGWGWFHELGHNHQWGAWTLPNQGEVTCNLYSLYMSENFMKMNRTTRYTSRATGQANYFASGVFPVDFETTTGMYQLMQLQENAGGRLNYTGGWDFWSRFLTRMQVLQDTAAVANDDVKIQTWIVETSKAANKNLVPFYRTWKFPVTAETEAAVSSLPAFDFVADGPCQEECSSNCCLPGSMSPTIDEVCKQTVPEGWNFNSKKDSSGNDLGNNAAAATGNWTTTAAFCSANPFCQGATTTGWLKYLIKDPSQWTSSFSDPCAGLLTRQDQSGPKLPSALAAGPSSLQAGSLCVEVLNGVISSGQRLALATCVPGKTGQAFKAGPAPNSNRIQTNSTGTSYCLDVYQASKAAGTAVTLYTCQTSNNQIWAVDSVGRIVPRHAALTGSASIMCLDTEGSSLVAGARLIINPCSDAASQKFVAASLVAAPCTSTVTIANGTFSCGTTQSGSTCSGQCDAGYSGTPTATCLNGQYTVSGSCVAASCTGAVTVANGTFSCGTTLSGSTCSGQCNTGYSGTPTASCLNGQYTVSGSCVAASCSGAVTIANGAFSCGTTLSGSTCAGQCNTGYSGKPTASCLNGQYTVSGSCVAASCTGAVTIANGTFSCGTTLSGSTCAGQCNTGYSGTPTASCLNGQYTVSGSCAPASCTGAVTIANGAFSCGTTLSGSTCAGQCDAGYSGTPTASCLNGQYTVSGSCVSTSCSSPVTLANAVFDCGTAQSGSTCSGVCNTNYVGSPNATCLNGQWTTSGSCVLSGPITRKSVLKMGTTSLCVAVNGNNINGQRLVLRTCTSSGAQPNSQLWISGVDPNTKRIQTASTTGAVFCVEVTKSATSVGSAVAINACTTANNQKWTKDTTGRWVAGVGSNMCLDTRSSATTAGTLYVINKCSTTASQKINAVAV